MSTEVMKAVRAWLMSGNAGLVVGVSAHDCYAKAWAASNISCSLGEMIDALHLHQQRPDQIRPKVWHLNMPDRPNR